MRRDDTEIEAPPVSRVQSSPVSTAPSENVGDDTFLDSLASLSKINGISLVQHGARLAVMGELLGSTLANLPAAMRADIAASFRDRVEELMSFGDDRNLPQEYQSALLIEVNRYLDRKSVV